MTDAKVERAQRGTPLSDYFTSGRRPTRGRAGAAARAGGPAAAAGAGPSASGFFLSPGTLTTRERNAVIDGIEKVVEGVFTHLPLKRARYGFDPIQRLRILRTQVDELTDDGFHTELADIVTRLRDAHTRYTGPSKLAGLVAVLPFRVEMAGTVDNPSYVVTEVVPGLDSGFAPGVTLEYWNGVPIDRAIQRHAEREVGGRPDTQRAWATQSLTFRPLRYGPPPDELWVVVGYRTQAKRGKPSESREIRIEWRVVDPNQLQEHEASLFEPTAKRELRRAQAVDPAAEDARRARILLFRPGALVGQQAQAPKPTVTSAGKAEKASVIDTQLTETLRAMSIDGPGGPYGHLRIFAFDTDPDTFISELIRLIPQLPERGLIIDIRSNPGGYIWAAEIALQLFTPNPIQPTKFSVLATPFSRTMAASQGYLGEDLAPWKASLEAAVRNGEQYAQAIPITPPDHCNQYGQHYGGPVVLVGDATTYSAGDLFSAGFVDNGIGPFVCVGRATGAGGANVWTYDDLKADLAGTTISLPKLPDEIGFSFSFRRATRSGPMEGIPIEDVGIAGDEYAMSTDDLLHDRRDLIAHCIRLLRKQPFSSLGYEIDKTKRTVTVATNGLDRVDALFDGHPGSTFVASDSKKLNVTYPAGTQRIELTGFDDETMRQRRRIDF